MDLRDEKRIPEDIDRIATDIVRNPLAGEDEPDYALYLLIARALLSERERATLAERERDEHLRAKNNLVLAAYPAMDAVDAIRKWCDGQRYANDVITVALLQEMLPRP